MTSLTQGLHDANCVTDFFVFTLSHCGNFNPMRYDSSSLNRVEAGKSHLVILA